MPGELLVPQKMVIDQYKSGWCPSDDSVEGRPDALLQMDNCTLDINGAVYSVMGPAAVLTLASPARKLYSRYLNGIRHNYAYCDDGFVYRDGAAIFLNPDTQEDACFAAAFNYIIGAAGTNRFKDSGSGQAINLGLFPSTNGIGLAGTTLQGPRATVGNLYANIYADVQARQDLTQTGVLTLFPEADGYGFIQTFGAGPTNLNTFSGPSGNTGVGTPDDILLMGISWDFSISNAKVYFDILLSAADVTGHPVGNYYRAVIDQSTFSGDKLYLKRSDFVLNGTDNFNWGQCFGFRIEFHGTPNQVDPNQHYRITGASSLDPHIYFQGGSRSLNGSYDYMEIFVDDNGSYTAKSSLSPVHSYTINHGQINVYPQTPNGLEPQANQIWIFRRTTPGTAGPLNRWYRTLVFNYPGGPTNMYDDHTDQDLLDTNVTYDTNMRSVNKTELVEDILAIVGPMEGRWFYFTPTFAYPSDINNPDSYNPGLGVRLGAASSEKFLWAVKVQEGVIYVGTSVDIYVLSGTFQTLPDGSVDIYYKPASCKYPPIAKDVEVYGGAVYYLASDGWRTFSTYSQLGYSVSVGQNPLLVTPNTDRLYRGITCYGYAPAPIRGIGPGSVNFPVVISQNKIWCFVTGTSRCEVWDFTRQYWRTFNNFGLGDATAAVSTQDGDVLVAFGTKLYTMNGPPAAGFTHNVKLMFHVQDGGNSRIRKDLCTIKLRMQTGAVTGSINVTLTSETGSSWTSGPLQSVSSITDVIVDLSSIPINPCKTLLLNISGNVTMLALEDIVIYYTPRPEQVSYLRILPSNMGTSARKRNFQESFTLDTMGGDVLFTPDVDGIAQPTATYNNSTNRPKTFSYYYPRINSDTDILIGVDYGYTIKGKNGNLFEWFGFDQDSRLLEIYPPALETYVIPVTNFKAPVKKRVRGWPFVLSAPANTSVQFIPIVDGNKIVPQSITFVTVNVKKTYRAFLTYDAFGIDYSGIFYCPLPFEIWEIGEPDVVQVLPPSRRFDQVGPEELFRYGRIKKMEFRMMVLGAQNLPATIPFKVFLDDESQYEGDFSIDANGQERTVYLSVPKSTSGNILRVEMGPTNFDFHRYYMRLAVFKTGKDTELDWITLPPPVIPGQA